MHATLIIPPNWIWVLYHCSTDVALLLTQGILSRVLQRCKRNQEQVMRQELKQQQRVPTDQSASPGSAAQVSITQLASQSTQEAS